MDASITHSDKERIQAQGGIRQIERERAMEQIALLMRNHEIELDDLDTLLEPDPKLS